MASCVTIDMFLDRAYPMQGLIWLPIEQKVVGIHTLGSSGVCHFMKNIMN